MSWIHCNNKKERQLMTSRLGIRCGKCGGELMMCKCPKHYWVISTECIKCGSVRVVSASCKECDFPFPQHIFNKGE